MTAIRKSALLALAIAAAASASAGPAAAQSASPPAAATPAPGAAAAPADTEVQQIALTPAMVDEFIAAKPDMDAVLDKLPEGTDQPDPKTTAKLDATAQKFKFADYKQYDTAENTIGIVMAGIDPETKQYVGPEAVIRKQIAGIQADKQISAKDKKDTVDQLTAAIPTIPKVQYPGNIDIVTKNYARLNEAMPQD